MPTEHAQWLVTECPFNRDNYPTLIGKVFANPPSYAVVVRIG
jgi:hypothetical protein